MSLLTQWLTKKGIEKEEDLSPEEKIVYIKYRHILSGETVSLSTIKEFCKSQISIIEGKIANGIDRPTDIQIASLHVYLNLLRAIEAPEAERESLERHLTQIIES